MTQVKTWLSGHPKLVKGGIAYHVIMAVILIAVWVALY